MAEATIDQIETDILVAEPGKIAEVLNPTNEFVFYCPAHPNEKIAVSGSWLPIQFINGVFRTQDRTIAETIRAANTYGMYFEGDLNKPIICRRCGWPGGEGCYSSEAIQAHYMKHLE